MKLILFLPHNDTHVSWMVPISKGFKDVKFVTFENKKSENAEMRLIDYGIDFHEYSPSLIYNLKPKLMIFANDWSNPDIFRQARELKIPTIVIQEGVLDFITSRSKRMLVADYAFIQGDIMRNYLKRPRVITTGNPKYDNLQELPLPKQNSIMVNCNFTYGVFVDIRDKWLNDVIDVLSEMKIHFFVSKHPRDYGSIREGIEVILSNAYLVNEQLTKCSIVITRFSTIIYEAIVAGREVIYYNPHGEDFGLLSTDNTGTIIYAKNKQELKETVIEAINRKKTNSYIKRRNSFLINHIGSIDHTATKQCQDEIKKIVERDKYPETSFYELYFYVLRFCVKTPRIVRKLFHKVLKKTIYKIKK